MREFFTRFSENALLLRGAEGEAVAHPRREPVLDWLNGVSVESWNAGADDQPLLPQSRDASVTAAWIHDALAGRHAIPAAIAHQVACCVRTAGILSGQA